MAQGREPSYVDLVYDVLRLADRPLTVQEIVRQVDSRRTIATRDPEGTIRSALSQGRQLVSTGEGAYGYLPNLLAGSLLRSPLAGKRPANCPLALPIDVETALWPDWLDTQKRKLARPVLLRLPSGDEVSLSFESFGRCSPGAMPDLLRAFLVENRASDGASLLIRVVDAIRGRYDLRYESSVKRDGSAILRRNNEIADAACQIVRQNRSMELDSWNLATVLLARGFYRVEPAPDSLETVLKNDGRLVDAGFHQWRLAATMTPQIEATIRVRKRLEDELSGRRDTEPEDVDQTLSSTRFRRVMERSLLDVSAFLSERRPGSADEANALLHGAMSHVGIPPRRLSAALDQAQDLMYDAWDCASPRERAKMARKALSICPDCADAYVLLAEDTARDAREAAELYAKGVAAGKRALGSEGFREYAGEFWSVVQTRPYMRARCGLAQSLWMLKKRKEAIAHVWDMLGLNPGDNQGMRYLLLSWLLETGDDTNAEKLLEQYAGDIAASWAYGRSLLAFRKEGDTEHARELWDKAKKVNPFVPDYLIGRKRLPSDLPDTIGFGDESEAMACAEEQIAAWRKTPNALIWLDAEGK